MGKRSGHRTLGVKGKHPDSPLVKCECLIGPLKRNDLVVESLFVAGFAEFDVLDMPEVVYSRRRA